MIAVIGTGHDAFHAAAELARTGAAVTLLVAPGAARTEPAERISSRGVVLDGRVAPLPMRRRDLFRLLGAAAPDVVAGYARARLGRRRRQLEGVGIEERTYEDWVRRRMGGAAHDLLYAAYAARRFGAPTSELSVSVARVHHGAATASSPPPPADVGGVEVRSALVRRLVVDGGRVRRIELDDGSIECDGVWIAHSPATVAHWLGESLEPALRVDAQRLVADTAVRVLLQGEAPLPDEVHVLDRDAPCFRVRRTVRGTAFDARVPYGETVDERAIVDAVVAMGLGSFSSHGARVEVVADAAPRWLAGTHARLRRVLGAWDALGIAGVGRSGTMSLVDRATANAFARALAHGEADQRELHRRLLDPPVRADDLDASLLRFVER